MQIFPSTDTSGLQASPSGTAAVMMRSKTSSDFNELLGGASRDEATEKISKTSPSESIEPTDILYLQQILSQMGLSKEQLANLGQLMVKGQNATSADLEAALTDKGYKELSSLTKMDVGTFLHKLGFTGPESDTLLAGLANGKTAAVWSAIQQKISGSALEGFSQEEFSALADALRLNDKAKKSLEKIFEQMQGADAEAKAASEALLLLGKAMDQQASADAQLKKALEKAMPDVLKNMEQRLAGQDQASTRVSKDEQYLSTLMRENSFAVTKNTMAREESDYRKQEGDAKSDKDALQKWSSLAKKKDSRENHVESLIERMNGKITLSQSLINAEINSSGQGQELSFAQSLRQGNLSARQAENVLMQMENGILENLSDGTKQLSLQLSPEELGTVNVILSVRSGEVSATIRPESHEVARAVEEQLHKIQAALEQQGLKVQRLEVQTQLPEHREFMNWQGAEHHNQEFMQREQARRARLARIRNVESSSLAQKMQHVDIRENISQSRLNLIA